MAASAATAAAAESPAIDPLVWLACATPLSRLPAVASQVYYFPYGHAEQCPAALPAPLPEPHLLPCTVAAVRLSADATTDEPYATISLVPGPHRDPPPGLPADVPTLPEIPLTANPNNQPDCFCYFAKQLTQSDANNGGGFSVPRFCADHIFPKLDFDADPPVQKLRMWDLLGNPWDFRHIYRGTPRRHLLTTGWSKFVNAKLLVAGDTVVFMRRPDRELLVGVRRAPRYPLVVPDADAAATDDVPRNVRARVPPQEVVDAARLAKEGAPFTVTYYPRQGAGEFVVPRKEVEEAVNNTWLPGTPVRMQVMEAEDSRRTEWANGTLVDVNPSMWRMLQVEWDATSTSAVRNRHVNAWQVESAGPAGYPPILKKLKMDETAIVSPPPCSASVPNLLILLEPQVPAGMQGARHDDGAAILPSPMSPYTTMMLFPVVPFPPTPSPTSSEIVNASSLSDVPNKTRSIQLFGTTITSPVLQTDTDADCDEVNQVKDAVPDETANGDASATSPVDSPTSKDDAPNQNDAGQEA